jgi:hypothetical protein
MSTKNINNGYENSHQLFKIEEKLDLKPLPVDLQSCIFNFLDLEEIVQITMNSRKFYKTNKNCNISAIKDFVNKKNEFGS